MDRTLQRPLLLLIVVLSSFAVAQDSEPFTISGTVVNSVTGEPVPHAIVELGGRTSGRVMSSTDGRFEFPGLPAGQYQLTARKPGFFTEFELTPKPPNTTAVAGPDSSPVRVKLVPEAVVFGHVEDENGDPLPQIDVRLFQAGIRDGRKYSEAVGYTNTNLNGEFRFANLRPGTYLAGAGGGIYQAGELASLTSTTDDSDAELLGFPPLTYYPNTRVPSAASPLRLTPGQKIELVFTLKHERVRRISGRVTGYSSGQNINVVLEQLLQPGANVTTGVAVDPRTGIFHARCVAGDYLLTASATGADGSALLAVLPVTVAADLAGLRLALAPLANIDVKLRPAFSHPADAARPPIGVDLVRADGTQSNWAEQSPDPYTLRIRNVAPGTYKVTFRTPSNYYVTEATWGATDLLRDPIVVSPGENADPILAVVRDDVASLVVSLRYRAPHVPIVFLLRRVTGADPFVFTIASDQTITFQYPPGDYYAWAFDTVDDLEFRNPEVLSKLESRASRITLSPGAKTAVTLDIIHRTAETP